MRCIACPASPLPLATKFRIVLFDQPVGISLAGPADRMRKQRDAYLEALREVRDGLLGDGRTAHCVSAGATLRCRMPAQALSSITSRKPRCDMLLYGSVPRRALGR